MILTTNLLNQECRTVTLRACGGQDKLDLTTQGCQQLLLLSQAVAVSSSVRELSLFLTRQAITHPSTVCHLTLTRLLISNITQRGISLDAVPARNLAVIDPFRVTAKISRSTLIRLLVSDITQIGT